ncbi:hypothetical protein F5Y15DRAFT_363491 [Xylariaceae sp. FL0016]|nr:hypothetical protein F5Y15DRAFT_363491 [Xylariaceae sp. FL0016]
MEALDGLVDLPSPSNSVVCMYGDTELYLDSTSTTTSTSPTESPYDLTFPHTYPSPEHTDGSGDTSQAEIRQSVPKPAAKRKRENRYKNAPPSVLSRRRAQNRASQRAYRERKDQRIKDLEILLGEAQQKNDVLSQAYATLQAEYMKLKSEQDIANHYQQPGLVFDPTITPVEGEMDLFLYGERAAGFTL